MVCMRYEIRTMTMPERVQEAMQMQVEAERRKRAAILESEGKREAAINVAEGEKRSRILASEAAMQERINEARGLAESIERQAEAKKNALEKVSTSLNKQGGHSAAALVVAEQYIKVEALVPTKSTCLGLFLPCKRYEHRNCPVEHGRYNVDGGASYDDV